MNKIIIINHNARGKGTYFRCLGFAKELVKNNYQVYLFCLRIKPKLWLKKHKEFGINFIELPWAASGGISGAIEHFFRGLYIFFVILFTPKIKVVHSFNIASPMVGWSTFLVFLVKRFKKIRLVIDWDDWWGKGGLTTLNKQGRLQEWTAEILETRIPPLADRVTLHNDLIKEHAIKKGVKEDKIFKIHNGADVEAYQDLYKNGYTRKIARQELGLPQDKIVLFFGGAVVGSVPFLLRVMKLIDNQHFLMIIIGPVSQEVIISVAQDNLQDRVIFRKWVRYDDFKKYLFASDILLLPRSNKNLLDKCTFPGRIGDYMMSGRPIVASDVGELSKVFREDTIGLLAKSDDEIDFKDKILNLVEDKNLRNSLGAKALEAGRDKYNWDVLTEVLISKVYCD